jgi:glycosyltransferase involved in cell wall biosynthesis
MKVLMVTSSFALGSHDARDPWLVELALVLREAGVDLEVLAPAHAGLPSHEVNGVSVHRYRYSTRRREGLDREVGAMDTLAGRKDLSLPGLSLISAGVLATARLARRKDYDVIHSHWPLPNGLLAAAGSCHARNEPRLVSTFHGAEIAVARSNRCARMFLAGITHNLDAAIANSSHTAGQVRELTGVQPTVIPLGPPRGAVNPGSGSGEAPDDGLLIVLSVGRMIERKGFPVLVRAARRLRGEARVVIVGDGEGRSAVEEEILCSGVEDVVRLAGRLPNTELAGLYRGCAVFCRPSLVDSRGYTEALGVVSIEAMSHAKSVVATSVGGIPDAVEHGVTGLLVAPNDEEALAVVLSRVVGDAALVSRLGEAGRERVRRFFSWERVVREHLAVYGAAG